MARVVVVTGAAGALGWAVFSHFAAAGDRVLAVDLSEALLAEALPKEAAPHRYLAVDLTRRDACREVMGAAIEEAGAPDVLCNIAGGFLMGEAVHETRDETWDFLFGLNARAIVNVAAVAVPAMLEAGQGKIVNVAAMAADAGAAGMGAYSASKAAVKRLTESMAQELRGQGINVNCIMPSIMDTPRNRADMPDADFGKWVGPEQAAAVVGFLASDAASAVHGAAIPVVGLS